MNRTAMFMLAWVAAAILLPIARLCGLVHWSWWICGAPLGLMALGIGLIILGVGVLGKIAASEEDDEDARHGEQASDVPPRKAKAA